MKKTTAAITLVGSFLVLALFATAHGSGYGRGYYGRGGYGYGSGYYDRGSRYEYRGGYGGRYYDDRYAYRGGARYYDDSRYEYRGDGRRPMPARTPAAASTDVAPAPANN